jgi:hypothetical protein
MRLTSCLRLERDDLSQGSGTPLFDPSSMGTTATQVPSNAALIDDSWPGIQRIGNWTCWEYPKFPTSAQEYWYNNTASETVHQSNTLIYTFYGPSLWYVPNQTSVACLVPELTGGFQGLWHQVLLRRRVGRLCRWDQSRDDRLVRLQNPRFTMVDQWPHGLEAQHSDNNAAVPTCVSNLRPGVSINRLLPVRPP